ncbi:MAG TPA: ABC transporter ATP-binding protein/permease [Candidatus Mediterraneibacter quadrami]|uniref:ABC transporter ATP-binding protein/permease n=1 Tax=Candidatus Mediterraneibacter quadrami TaxID=2838684 RepID=A0A9D2U6K0_9FIRM|nr:ABC transporter ATP-binding protein/permease [Candidatus Mediterraneibacter quadrami]
MADKKKKTGQGKTLKKVFRHLGKYRIFVVFSVLLATVSVALTLYIPKLTGHAVDYIVTAGRVDFPGVIKVMIRIGICTLITALAQWLMNVCNNKMTYQVVQDIRNEAFRKIEILPLKYIDSRPHGEVVSRVIADVDQFADGLLMGFTQLFTGIATIVGTFCFMLSVNVMITFVVVLITPVSFLVANFIARRTFSMFRLQSEIRGEQTGLIDEMVENQKVVQAFGRGQKVTEQFDEINERLGKASLKATFFSSITNPATRFVNSLVYTGVGIAGAFGVVNGSLTVGQLSSFLSYANQYTKPFNEISGVVTEFQNAVACAQRIFDLIEEEPQMPEPADAVTLDHVQGNVKAEHVDFSYEEGQQLIRDFNLDVKPGQRIAIVGPTGCGKTTFINLLMRFYDVKDGVITVEGYDIREVTRRSLREGYGMVLQDTWLKAGTIRDNITMGRPDASEEEIVAAAKASHIHGFIRRLPKGYDTWITEEGGGLSQGQKQLLCIARVMLCRPPMLILDEATSSIDTRTEMKIQDAFAELMKGRTTFIVAHRLSTIREADVILVMKDGQIIEQGNHQSLLAQGGFYRHLYESQFAHTAQ